MQILFVFSLLFAILVAIFAVMNSDPVTITLLWKQFQFSQAIVILGSALVGAIIVALLGVFNKVKSSFKIRELNNKLKDMERQMEELKKQSLDEKVIENKLKVEEDEVVKENVNIDKVSDYELITDESIIDDNEKP